MIALANSSWVPTLSLFPFAQGRARVKSQNGESIIDSSGNFVAKQPVVLDGIRFSEGLIAIRRDRKLATWTLTETSPLNHASTGVESILKGLRQFSWRAAGCSLISPELRQRNFRRMSSLPSRFPMGSSLATSNAQSPRKFGYVDKNGKWAVKPAWD